MTLDSFAAVPPERRDAARSACAAAFVSAPYLLRLETARDAFRNPQRSYPCMRAAADAGVAPPLHHADATAGIAIMDFLPRRPLLEYPSGASGLMRDLGSMIARLQATPFFPPLGDYAFVLERMLALIRESNLFSAGLLDPHAEGFERIRQAYPWNSSALVSSHNDINPGNILFDGERLWLIDWEIAFRTEPLVDIAIVANNFAVTPAEEDALLQAWLGRAPDRSLRARLLLMRLLTRLFYGCLMLSMFIGRQATESELPAFTLGELDALARQSAGDQQPKDLHFLGKACLAGFLAGLRAPGFEEALVIAQQG